jgi:hypothetical protein
MEQVEASAGMIAPWAKVQKTLAASCGTANEQGKFEVSIRPQYDMRCQSMAIEAKGEAAVNSITIGEQVVYASAVPVGERTLGTPQVLTPFEEPFLLRGGYDAVVMGTAPAGVDVTCALIGLKPVVVPSLTLVEIEELLLRLVSVQADMAFILEKLVDPHDDADAVDDAGKKVQLATPQKALITGTEKIGEGGWATLVLRHHATPVFIAHDLTFAGTADGVEVHVIQHASHTVLGNTGGIPTSAFDPDKFIRGTGKGAVVREGEEITALVRGPVGSKVVLTVVGVQGSEKA